MAQSGGQADDAAIAAGGYGYRGRIGFLQPGIVGEAIPVQFYRMAPPGVTLVTTSLGLRELTVGEVESALDKTEAAARELGKSKPGCIYRRDRRAGLRRAYLLRPNRRHRSP
jgi:hypothetical protein